MVQVGVARSHCPTVSKVCCELGLCNLVYAGPILTQASALQLTLRYLCFSLLMLPLPLEHPFPNLGLVIHHILRSTFISASSS